MNACRTLERRSIPARVLACALVGLVPSPGVAQANPGVSIVSDEIRPRTIQPGEIAVRRIVVLAPEGVRMLWPSVLSLPEGVEPSGEVRIERRPDARDGVRWTVSYPFTGWLSGGHTVAPLGVQVGHPADTVLGLPPLPFEVAGVERAFGTHRVPDGWAPPAPPYEARPTWRSIVAVLIGGLGCLAALGAWMELRGVTGGSRSSGSPPPDGGPRTVLEPKLLEGPGVAWGTTFRSPGEAVMQGAREIRALPALGGLGISEASTTREVLQALSAAGCGELSDVAAPLLGAADAYRFGGIAPREADAERWIHDLVRLVPRRGRDA